MCVFVCERASVCINRYVLMAVSAVTHNHLATHTQLHIHAYMDTQIDTHTQTHTHTYTHAHTLPLPLSVCLISLSLSLSASSLSHLHTHSLGYSRVHSHCITTSVRVCVSVYEREYAPMPWCVSDDCRRLWHRRRESVCVKEKERERERETIEDSVCQRRLTA